MNSTFRRKMQSFIAQYKQFVWQMWPQTQKSKTTKAEKWKPLFISILHKFKKTNKIKVLNISCIGRWGFTNHLSEGCGGPESGRCSKSPSILSPHKPRIGDDKEDVKSQKQKHESWKFKQEVWTNRRQKKSNV